MKFLFTSALLLLLSTAMCQGALNIYGGISHDVYLGCLNCGTSSTNSIWNSKGLYGSNQNANSVWNINGMYGSVNSSTSAFNPTASDPPVIYGRNGSFVGYFTINEYKTQRAGGRLLFNIYENYKQIRNDVGRWYDKIFK